MGRGALAAAWLTALLPGTLAGLDPAWRLEPGSHLGWALVPWIALAGLPGGAAGSGTRRTAPVVTWALALPTLALAARLDHAAGASAAHLAPTAVLGSILVLLLALAGSRPSRRSARRHAVCGLHGILWACLVPGTALASWSLGLAGAAPEALRVLAAASPVTWALARAGEVDAAWGSSLVAALGPVAVAIVCLLATTGGRER